MCPHTHTHPHPHTSLCECRSNFRRYFKVAAYLAKFTQETVVIAMGIPSLKVGASIWARLCMDMHSQPRRWRVCSPQCASVTGTPVRSSYTAADTAVQMLIRAVPAAEPVR